MCNELTKYEQCIVDRFNNYEKEAQITMRKVETFRKVMLSVLGPKANCDLCGNQHWPLCGSEVEE